MATSDRSTLVGVFTNRDQADRAIDELRRAGISYNHIRLAERGSGSFLDNLKSLFTGQGTTANSADDLMRMGMPEQDAGYYQNQLEANRAIVIVKDVDRIEQAFTILRQSGAYDINVRLRTAERAVPSGQAAPGVRQGAAEQAVPPPPPPGQAVPPGQTVPGTRQGTAEQAVPPGQAAPPSQTVPPGQAVPPGQGASPGQAVPGTRQGTAEQAAPPGQSSPGTRPGTYNPPMPPESPPER